MEPVLTEEYREHLHQDNGRNTRRTTPTWEQAGPELWPGRYTRTGQQSIPPALLKHDQDGPLSDMTCEYSSELE